MLLLSRGRLAGRRYVSPSCTHVSSSSAYGSAHISMALRPPSHSLQNPNSRPLYPKPFHKCYLQCKRLLSTSFQPPTTKTYPTPARSIMTERQDHSNGALNSYEHEAPIHNKLKQMKIRLTTYESGEQKRTLCPMCGGGQSGERSLSVNISDDGYLARWICFRGKCGWKGYTEIPRKSARASFQEIQASGAVKKEIFEESLRLQELSAAQQEYLQSRGITQQTLNRNGVKQLRKGEKSLLAFPYREGGEVVSCKYYAANLGFEEEKGTRKIFYGLDDIKDANDIIIVGRELDKLALEEAGILNCVSVPDIPDGVRVKPSDKKSKTEVC